MIEKVKKMLEKYCDFIDGDCAVDLNDVLDIDEAAQQICQLFPKTKENPDGYEPKPDILDKCKCGHILERHDCGVGYCLIEYCTCGKFEPKEEESTVKLPQVVGLGGEVDDSDMTMEETEAAILAIIKPDEGRLLAREELYAVDDACRKEGIKKPTSIKRLWKQLEAQDAKTTSVLRREYDKLVIEAYNKGYDRAKAECQERVERIFKKIEDTFKLGGYDPDRLEALKEKELK